MDAVTLLKDDHKLFKRLLKARYWAQPDKEKANAQ